MQKTLKKSLIIFTLATLAILTTVFFFYSKNILSSDLRINEISFSKNDGNDWVEIYNPGLNTKSLKGMYLTDDSEDFTKYEIKKDIIIPPKSFVIIYGKNYESDDDDALIANFAIKNGETVYLINSKQEIVDSLTVIASDDNKDEITIGRFPDGSSDTFLMSTPTQGKINIKDRLPETKPNL